MLVMILETWNNRGYYHLHIMMHMSENNAYLLMKSFAVQFSQKSEIWGSCSGECEDYRLWGASLCGLLLIRQYFDRTYYLHVQCSAVLS